MNYYQLINGINYLNQHITFIMKGGFFSTDPNYASVLHAPHGAAAASPRPHNG